MIHKFNIQPFLGALVFFTLVVISESIVSAQLVLPRKKGKIVARSDQPMKFPAPGSPESDTLPDDAAIPDFGSDFVFHSSAGWFPEAYTRCVSYGIHVTGGGQYDKLPSQGLNSTLFLPTSAPFVCKDPFEDDQSIFKKKFSDDNQDDGNEEYSSSYNSYGLSATFNTPVIIIKGNISYDILMSRLYSVDTTRSYLSLSGAPQSFKQIDVASVERRALSVGMGVMLPIYGAFIATEEMRLSSYYYLVTGMTVSAILSSRLTQYSQIATEKDRIRFSTGYDTLLRAEDRAMSDMRTLQAWWDNGIGWKFASFGIMFNTEMYVSIPLFDVAENLPWRQYRYGFRLAFGYEFELNKK